MQLLKSNKKTKYKSRKLIEYKEKCENKKETIQNILKEYKAITLISLVITIILLIILASLAINLSIGESGIFNKAKKVSIKYEEQEQRERLEAILAQAAIEKETNIDYNNKEFLDSIIEKENMKIYGNVVFVDKWKFEIDREELKIKESLGKEELITIETPYIGTTSFTTKIAYVYKESEVEKYIYIIDNEEIVFDKKEYTKEELEAETTHTIKVIATYKDGKEIESNMITIKLEPKTYLYSKDITSEEIMGGFNNNFQIDKILVSIDESDKSIKVTGNAVASYGFICSTNKINLKEYKKLKFEVEDNGNSRGSNFGTINIAQNINDSYNEGYQYYSWPIDNTGTEKTEKEIDLTDINEELYIRIGAYGTGKWIKVYSMWLEK